MIPRERQAARRRGTPGAGRRSRRVLHRLCRPALAGAVAANHLNNLQIATEQHSPRPYAIRSPAEVRLAPDLLAQVRLHLRDVAERGRVPPLAREPGTEAAPDVALVVLTTSGHAVEPGLIALIACAPDRVGGVGIHRSRPGDGRPAAVPVGVLQDPVGHRALARVAVLAGLVTWRAVGWVRGPATEGALMPPALHGRLGEDDVLVDAPLAGRPPEYVDRGASEVAVDPPGQLLRRGVGRAEELRANVTAFPAVVRLVGRPVLGPGRGVDEVGAKCIAGQLRAGRQRLKVDARLAESASGTAGGRPRDDQHERHDDPVQTPMAETAASWRGPIAIQRHELTTITFVPRSESDAAVGWVTVRVGTSSSPVRSIWTGPLKRVYPGPMRTTPRPEAGPRWPGAGC